jgi:hypothetical protein
VFSQIDEVRYLDDLAIVAGLSPLFSESLVPFVHSRFAERLFCLRTGYLDMSRKDISFDAISLDNKAVGIKTYVAGPASTSKLEKVAEFTAYATKGNLAGITGESLAIKVADLRNARILSDAAEISADLSVSFYHCVVRTPGAIFFLEQKYETIQVNNLSPTDKFGFPSKDFSETGHVYFNDGTSDYAFNVAKNVLYKRFSVSTSLTSQVKKIGNPSSLGHTLSMLSSLVLTSDDARLIGEEADTLNTELEPEYVVLPLYSPTRRAVMPASGINQWNAAGRMRSFGESYIPVPKRVHQLRPGFFPARDTPFKLRLPNGEIVLAKICQEGDKALMANPNSALCKWLFSTIDGSFDISSQRLVSSRPYTYDDLEKIGKDSVRISKVSGKDWEFEIQSANCGSYEEFVKREEELDE